VNKKCAKYDGEEMGSAILIRQTLTLRLPSIINNKNNYKS